MVAVGICCIGGVSIAGVVAMGARLCEDLSPCESRNISANVAPAATRTTTPSAAIMASIDSRRLNKRE
jgi:hypothetical protein